MNIKEMTAGIDISKSRLDICIKNHGGVLAVADYANDTVGAGLLLEFLAKHGCLDVAMESTGPYWYGIYDYLTEHGVRVTLVNPAHAKTHILNKTDTYVDGEAGSPLLPSCAGSYGVAINLAPLGCEWTGDSPALSPQTHTNARRRNLTILR